jgi:hypothetical protein
LQALEQAFFRVAQPRQLRLLTADLDTELDNIHWSEEIFSALFFSGGTISLPSLNKR